jgi:hypothetical protein
MLTFVRETKVWAIELVIGENSDETEVQARLRVGDVELAGWGRARRSPSDPDRPRVGEELAVARRAGAEARLWLCHYSWRVVAPWRALSDSVRLVDSTRLAHMRTPPAARAERMAALDIDALNLHWSDWSAPLALTFRSAGRKLLAWDAQDDASLGAMLALGVDGVFSDHVARMMSALGDAQAVAQGS